MKKRLLAIVMTAVLVLSFTACDDKAAKNNSNDDNTVVTSTVDDDVTPTADDPATDDDVVNTDVDVTNDDVTTADNNFNDDQDLGAISRYNDIMGYYYTYITGGINADSTTFVSPETGAPIYEAVFAMVDVNNDGVDDVVISGKSGLRDQDLSEVYYYEDINGAFYAATFTGYIALAGKDYVYIVNEDNDGPETLYCDTSVSTFAMEGCYPVAYESSVSTLNAETGDYDEVITYYVEGEETTEEAFNAYINEYYGDVHEFEYYPITEEVITQIF